MILHSSHHTRCQSFINLSIPKIDSHNHNYSLLVEEGIAIELYKQYGTSELQMQIFDNITQFLMEEVPVQNEQINLTSNVSEDDSSLDRSFESCANAYDFCVHFINKADESVDSQFVNAEDNLTLDECLTILQDKLKRAMNDVVFKAALEEDPLPGSTLLSEFVKGPDADLLVFYEGVKPILKEVVKEMKYESITKYSYLDEKKFVKVYIPLEKIGELPADKITSRFLDRSFQIRIHDYQGKNWIFAVPKTQCVILTKTSKVMQKADKLIVCLGKMAEADNWFSLHKVKCIGEKDTD